MNAFVFFDVDETLIRPKSMFDFLQYWYEHTHGAQGPAMYAERWASIRVLINQGMSRHQLNRLYYSWFAGVSYKDLELAGRAWFDQRCRAGGLFKEAVVQRLHTLRQSGIEPVLVSGSMVPLLAPLAGWLGVEHLLCAELQLDGGLVTGELLQGAIGPEKQLRLHTFLQQHGVSNKVCHAYGDHISDLAMLEAVDYPHAVDPCAALREVAESRHWPILLSEQLTPT